MGEESSALKSSIAVILTFYFTLIYTASGVALFLVFYFEDLTHKAIPSPGFEVLLSCVTFVVGLSLLSFTQIARKAYIITAIPNIVLCGLIGKSGVLLFTAFAIGNLLGVIFLFHPEVKRLFNVGAINLVKRALSGRGFP